MPPPVPFGVSWVASCHGQRLPIGLCQRAARTDIRKHRREAGSHFLSLSCGRDTARLVCLGLLSLCIGSSVCVCCAVAVHFGRPVSLRLSVNRFWAHHRGCQVTQEDQCCASFCFFRYIISYVGASGGGTSPTRMGSLFNFFSGKQYHITAVPRSISTSVLIHDSRGRGAGV